MRTSPAVAKVIQSCLDDERTLLQESHRVDPQREAVLVRLADERRRFAEELERFNGQTSRESWSSLAREVGRSVWMQLGAHNAGDAVAACRRSQHRTAIRYEKVLALELPPALRVALQNQRERVDDAGDELAKLE
jgi:biotin-(acetyl-CoA carboxylase) ligase